MVNKSKIKSVEDHIKALNNSYKNLIEILNQTPEKDNETGNFKMNDDKIKAYAEGISKTASTADQLLNQITVKEEIC